MFVSRGTTANALPPTSEGAGNAELDPRYEICGLGVEVKNREPVINWLIGVTCAASLPGKYLRSFQQVRIHQDWGQIS